MIVIHDSFTVTCLHFVIGGSIYWLQTVAAKVLVIFVACIDTAYMMHVSRAVNVGAWMCLNANKVARWPTTLHVKKFIQVILTFEVRIAGLKKLNLQPIILQHLFFEFTYVF